MDVFAPTGDAALCEVLAIMKTLTPALLLAAGLSLPNAARAAEPSAHDGTWSVELVTESGLCTARASYAVAIRGGQVRLASASGGARVGGRVAPDGSVGLTVSNGAASGTGTGRLQNGSGSGTWSASALCSGRWTARRGDTRTARAD